MRVYRPVVGHPVLRRILPALAVSAVGDGMSVVAVSWLALQLAPVGQRGVWVAIAVAAYSLPSAAGGVLFGRVMSGRSGANLTAWNAVLRAVGLGAVVVVYAAGALTLPLYVTLLAASALLGAWGSAGRYTLIAEVLPQRHHLAGNAVLTVIAEIATIAGPPLAGLLISLTGPVVVIAADAASFAVLAVMCRLAVPAAAGRSRERPRGGGFAAIARDRTRLGLLALSFAFFLFFGPFYAAMPVHVVEDMHGSATLLGAYYTAFGIGALAGGLGTGYLRRWPLMPTTIGTVILVGAAMLPLGLGAPVGVSVCAFAVAGAAWGPFMATSMALFQRSTPVELLPRVLAANSTVLVLAVPLGTLAGGPLVATLGPRPTLLACAVAILALGAVAAAGVRVRSHLDAPLRVRS